MSATEIRFVSEEIKFRSPDEMICGNSRRVYACLHCVFGIYRSAVRRRATVTTPFKTSASSHLCTQYSWARFRKEGRPKLQRGCRLSDLASSEPEKSNSDCPE